MSVELGDLLVLVGAGLLLWGLFAIDWRLALIGGGSLLLAAGLVRLRSTRRTE